MSEAHITNGTYHGRALTSWLFTNMVEDLPKTLHSHARGPREGGGVLVGLGAQVKVSFIRGGSVPRSKPLLF